MSEQDHKPGAVERVAARHVASMGKTGGEVRFIKDRGGDDKDWGWTPPGASERNIDPDYTFDAKNLKPLAQTLRAALMALGHIQTARTIFTKIRSQTISPDGNIGGKGYVLTVKDVRKLLSNCDEALSSVTDSIYDEMQAVHWHPQVQDSGGNPRERDDVKQIMDDVAEIRQSPENWAEGEEKEMDSDGGSKQARRKLAYGGYDDDRPSRHDIGSDPEDCPAEDLKAAAATFRHDALPLMKALYQGFRQRGWSVEAEEFTGYFQDRGYALDELQNVSFTVSGMASQKILIGNKEVVLDRGVSLVLNGLFEVGTVEVEVEKWDSPSGHGNDPDVRDWTVQAECPNGEPESLTMIWGATRLTYQATLAGMQKLLGDFDKHWLAASKVRSRLRRRRHADMNFEAAVTRVAARWIGRAQ